MNFSGTVLIGFLLIIQFGGEVQCQTLLGGLVNTVGGLLANGLAPILQSPTSRALMRLKTVNK